MPNKISSECAVRQKTIGAKSIENKTIPKERSAMGKILYYNHS